MKKASDPRHKLRQHLVQQLFSYSFNSFEPDTDKLRLIFSSLKDLDQIISTNAPEWPLDQINRIDLSILRLAVYELSNTNVPAKVVIDEAVELGKEFGSESSAKFINGVLGNYLKHKPVTNQT